MDPVPGAVPAAVRMGTRLPGLCLAEDSAVVSGVGGPVRDPEESQGAPGHRWPKELITLRPGESGRQLALEKIRELSDSDHKDPFMVADLGLLASRHQTFLRALPRVAPFYAVKCNSSPWVLRVLAALGTGFDCASQVELEQVLSLGVSPSRIIYANPCKPVSHIKYAARHGVQLLTFDSEEELTKVAQYHPEARLVLRLWVQDRNSTFRLSCKFGARLEACEHLLKSARDLGLAVVGVSFHVGSDCQDPHSFTQAIMDSRRALDMGRGVGHDMNILDIGGGFPGVEGSEPKFEEVARVIDAALTQHFPEESGVQVMAEPGRFYAESVFTAAVCIIAKKVVLEPGGRRKLLYYLNESHYGVFRIFRREPVPRVPIVVKELPADSPLFPCILYGPTCDSLDMIFLEEVQLPELDMGDWLIFPSLGAYSSVMSSTFNGFPPASICYTMRQELRCLGGARKGQGTEGLSPGPGQGVREAKLWEMTYPLPTVPAKPKVSDIWAILAHAQVSSQ